MNDLLNKIYEINLDLFTHLSQDIKTDNIFKTSVLNILNDTIESYVKREVK